MKICVVTSTYPRSADDAAVPWLRETVNLVNGSPGNQVMVLAPSYKGLSSHSVDGVRVERFRYFLAKGEDLTHDSGAPTKIRSPKQLAKTGFYVAAGALALARLHRRERFDVLHVHWPFPHAAFALWARIFRRAPMVLNFHGAELLLAKKIPVVNPFLRFAGKRAAALLTNSSFTAAKVQAVGLPMPTILPYGSPLPERQIPPRPAGRKNLLFVGRLIERKGVEYLLRAMPLLADDPQIHLTVVGAGVLKDGLMQLARELGQQDRVTFKSDLSPEELTQEYVNADIFVLPAIVDSRGDTEGLGVVLIESIAFGLPVIASDVGGIPDVAIDGQTAILVPEKDPAALAKAIRSAFADPGQTARLVEQAKQHVAENFSWDVILRRTLDLYEGLPRR